MSRMHVVQSEKLTDVLTHAHAYRSEEKKVASTEAFNHVETR